MSEDDTLQKLETIIGQMKINSEYERLLPKINKEEFKALKQSIKTEGQHFPIAVNPDLEILDGHHRFRACKELGITPKYEVRFFKNKLLEKKFVIESNLRRRHLNDFQKAELGYPLLEIERELAKEREIGGGKTLASNEARVGKSAQIVADEIGLSRGTFERAITIIEKAPESLKEEVREGKRSIASAYQMITTEESKEKVFEPKIFDVWNFSTCNEKFGVPNFPGRIPGEIVQNVLYYFTKEGDFVVDPMAGSGTTYDVCLSMNRKCLCFDVAPIREEIKKHDITKGFPEETKNCDLVFLDPPYWSMQKGNYAKSSVSSLSLPEYYSFIEGLAKNCLSILKEKGVVAFLIQNQTEKDLIGEPYIDHAFNCFQIFVQCGFKPIRRISVPLSTQQFQSHDVERAKKERHMLGIVRDLIIFQKV